MSAAETSAHLAATADGERFDRAVALATRARRKRHEARLFKSSAPGSPPDHGRAHWANYEARRCEEKVRSIARAIILENARQS